MCAQLGVTLERVAVGRGVGGGVGVESAVHGVVEVRLFEGRRAEIV
jgi:hypothetical protein